MQSASFSHCPDPTSRVGQLLRFRQISLALSQLLLSPPAFRHVHHRTHVLNEVAGWIENGVSYYVDISELAAGMDDSIIRLEPCFLTLCRLDRLPKHGSIIGMDALIKRLKSRSSTVRIKT